ncbi:serine/threonine protein kinase [Ureaplasma sp. ES3154-GEN]|uniref:serine/threonine-protein kinase n=1 Tax=Ureaplasma sp. ES3154-GEN TaxID=2984844 RepID=UPI0021E8843E|nr:serine/threonine-protein kinase [Ureaplasma sp. ES3154-GEN]MCV3743808.1 serine/threonine protein kinase [Ureaplasma sp. ES3154-GEN]
MPLLFANHTLIVDPQTNVSYKVIKHIANGGFSEIYLVQPSNNTKLVVLKIITTNDVKQKNVLRDEIRVFNMLKNINHQAQEYLIKYHTNFNYIYHNQTYLCLILEYFDGMSLRDYLDKNILLTPSKARLIVQQIGSVLDFFHNLSPRLIHKDLKPENILINQSLTKIKLIDYGASYVAYDNKVLTIDDELKCTTVYASPQLVQIDYRQHPYLIFNPQFDLHSLAVLYYELLTGTDPLHYERFKKFPKQDIYYLKAWQTFDFLDLDTINPQINPATNQLIRNAVLSKSNDKTQIFTSVQDFLTALKQIENNTQTKGLNRQKNLVLYNDLRSLNKITSSDQPWYMHLGWQIAMVIFLVCVLLTIIIVVSLVR